MTKDEALKLALMTLEGWDNHDKWVWPETALEQAKRNTKEAITAIKEALAQPVQPEQEPVAWTTMPEADDWDFVSGNKDPTGKLEGKWFPLYTTPPAAQPVQEPLKE